MARFCAVEPADSLDLANWRALAIIDGGGALKSVITPNPGPQRFYRVRFK